MNDYCPMCNDAREIERIREKKPVEVRGERFEVEVEYFRCTECGGEFERGDSEVRPVEEAYRLYRERHGMTQPAEIREFRRRYGLTQRELGDLLGWGGATLSRYENGGLQDDAHDRMLRLAMNPGNLLDLVEKNGESLPHKKKAALAERIGASIDVSSECTDMLGRIGRFTEPSIYNGYRRFDTDRVRQVILFFTQNPRLKTVLNKLLYYSDFMHFKTQGTSITGLSYAHLPFGPTPDQYESIFASLAGEGIVRIDEIIYSEPDIAGETYQAVDSPDMGIFSRSEREILDAVTQRFEGFSAKMISDRSHREDGYLRTTDGQIISYEYAEKMV